MQVRNVLLFVLIFITVIIVSSLEVPKNADQYYDRNSIKQNEKLVRLFLRLAFQIANRVVELNNSARNQVANRLDSELQNLTLKEIMYNQDQPKNDASTEIQSRLLSPIDSKPLIHIFKSVNNFELEPKQPENKIFNKTVDNISMDSVLIDETVEAISNFEFNKTADAIIDKSNTLISDSNMLLAINNISDINGRRNSSKNLASQNLSRISAEDDQDDAKNTIPALRLLSDVDTENNSNINSSEKIEIITEISAIDTDKKNLSTKNLSNILEPEEKISNQSQALQKVTEENAFSVSDRNQDERSRRNIKELDAESCKDKTIDDIIEFSLNDSDGKYDPDLTEFMSKMKLQDIVNQLNKIRE